MDRMIYLSMAGAKAAMERQDVVTHNLANVSTNGFRAELQAFRAVPVRGDGASTRVYALETTVGHDDAPGAQASTGRDLDVAMQGNAWLALQGLDGQEAYTRAGSLDTQPDGTLVVRGGLPVLGTDGPIVAPPGARLQIAVDGTVAATAGNAPPQVIGRLKLVTPETKLQRGEDGLFRTADAQPLDADPTARVASGALEGSNVSPVEAMVAMISAARQFEHQMRLLQTAERQEQQAARLLSPNGM